MKKWIWIFSIILIAFAFWFFFSKNGESKKETYSFVEITRGNLSSKITSSGTLDPVSTVEVGTQVSGMLDKIYVDFNDNVRRGQLLALLDTTFLAASVRDANAALERAAAQYHEAATKHELNKKLFEKKIISELEFLVSETSVVTNRASVQSAKSSLERAKTNLDYAFIRSPIDGTIIHRNVEEGQTVAASLSAPQLFILAEDLSKMEILVNVDESDIGRIKEGQRAVFTVQAYDQKEFEGFVNQIRLQPQTISNVVNYTVVVNADNEEGILLPGMTATVDFYVEEKEDVLLVPAAALRFSPPEDLVAAYREKMRAQFENAQRDSSNGGERRGGFFGGQGGMAGGFSGSVNRNSFGSLWYMDENNELAMTGVFLGLSDGKNTEIIRGRNIEEGMKVINGYETSSSTNSSDTRSPFQPSFGRGFR